MALQSTSQILVRMAQHPINGAERLRAAWAAARCGSGAENPGGVRMASSTPKA
jgi:hypothetical protein